MCEQCEASPIATVEAASVEATAGERWQAAHRRGSARLIERENRDAREHFERRRKERREAKPTGKAGAILMQRRLRIAELRALLWRRYQHVEITDWMVHCHADVETLVAHLLSGEHPEEAERDIALICHACSDKIRADIMRRARGILPRKAHMSATAIGQRVCLTARERAELGITTIRAFDETLQDATRRRRAHERTRQARVRAKRREERHAAQAGRICECGAPLPEGRSTRRYCSERCKKRAQRGRSPTLQMHVPLTRHGPAFEESELDRDALRGRATAPQAPTSADGTADGTDTTAAVREHDLPAPVVAGEASQLVQPLSGAHDDLSSRQLLVDGEYRFASGARDARGPLHQFIGRRAVTVAPRSTASLWTPDTLATLDRLLERLAA